jgi:hypothetical protein
MEYTINGIITLSPGSELRLSSDVNFSSPSKAGIILSSESDDKLSVLIKLEADNDANAQELAQLELNRICNVLSFYHNVSIFKSSVTGMSYTKTTSKGNVDMAVTVTVGLHVTASAMVTLGNKSLAKLVSYLGKNYSTDCEEVIYMWREAISNQSSALRYILLYRLLEFLFDSDTRKLTSWIMKEDSQVQVFRDRRRGDHTIYTYLRDHVHPKKKNFPMKQIQENESRLRVLVQKAIKEKFNI